MTKMAIVYVSKHHGNTENLIKGIAELTGAEAYPLSDAYGRDFSEYGLIGFASGIYGFDVDPKLAEYAFKMDKLPSKAFLIYTSGTGQEKFGKPFLDRLKRQGYEIEGFYHCRGYNTFGPFKLIGGTSKGHPDDGDIRLGAEFVKKLMLKAERV